MEFDYMLNPDDAVANRSELILVTGAAGFIGSQVVSLLLHYGFRRLRCLVRPSSHLRSLTRVIEGQRPAEVEILEGNLLSPSLCAQAVSGVSVIYHLAAGIDKSFPGAFMNSVVTTRNLLEAVIREGRSKRLVNVSSLAAYSSRAVKRGGTLDETTPIEADPVSRGEAYCYGKVKQDELVFEYARKFNLPVVLIRPGAVFGPGRSAITGRVGIDTFGLYLHLGGANKIPFTYVDNCAEAIVLAGLKKGIDGEVFNVVDDDLPTSRQFLRLFKQRVGNFKSLYIPYPLFYLFSFLWEKYSAWSQGQLPPAFNRSRARTEWLNKQFSNRKIKSQLGWRPRVPMAEALERYFVDQHRGGAA
jgi:nucleoside-diphosphate-sugar epimerase